MRSLGEDSAALGLEFNEEDFKQFLIDIQILPKPEKREKNDCDVLFRKILRILTPSQCKKPIISVRNVMALFFAIFNT